MTQPCELDSSLRAEYELLLVRMRQQREQADRLRALAEQLEERTAADEHLLEEMAGALGIASQLRLEELSPLLRGQRLQEIAKQVLESHWGAGREIHYRQWYELVVEQGYRVSGKDPVANFLAQVHRAPGVISRGQRSGRYQLAAN